MNEKVNEVIYKIKLLKGLHRPKCCLACDYMTSFETCANRQICSKFWNNQTMRNLE